MKKYFYLKQNMEKDTQKGFTLIETFIAVTLLMTAVVGPLTIAQKALSSAYYTRDRITAYYLAQDAIEFVHSIRDNGTLGSIPESGGSGWSSFLAFVAPCMGSGKICRFDSSKIDYTSTSNNGIFDCSFDPNGVCLNMNYSSTTGFYNYDSIGTNNHLSPFRREVNVESINNSADPTHNEVKVIVTITWKAAILGRMTSFTVQDNFLDWQ